MLLNTQQFSLFKPKFHLARHV